MTFGVHLKRPFSTFTCKERQVKSDFLKLSPPWVAHVFLFARRNLVLVSRLCFLANLVEPKASGGCHAQIRRCATKGGDNFKKSDFSCLARQSTLSPCPGGLNKSNKYLVHLVPYSIYLAPPPPRYNISPSLPTTRYRSISSPSLSDIPPFQTQFLCVMVDFGNEEVIPLANVKPLHKNFSSVPMMAVKASLTVHYYVHSGVKPVGDSWSDVAIKFFNDTIHSKYPWIRIDKQARDSVYVHHSFYYQQPEIVVIMC
eukprot:sb/3468568/